MGPYNLTLVQQLCIAADAPLLHRLAQVTLGVTVSFAHRFVSLAEINRFLQRSGQLLLNTLIIYLRPPIDSLARDPDVPCKQA